jgi:hypothetical protein
MPILQTNVLPIREIKICDGWCLPPCWKRKTIPAWLWCDAVHDFAKCQVIDTPGAIFVQARKLLADANEGLFLFYQLDDLEGARRYKKKIAKIQALLEKYD